MKIIKNLRPPLTILPGIIIVPAGAALNVLLCWLSADILHAPIFMDSLFTAAVAALYGPIPGMITGLLTNSGLELIYHFSGIHIPFAFCNMATGLIVGLMTPRVSSVMSVEATITVLLVTLANSLLGALIAIFVFSGDTGVSLDYIVSSFIDFGQSLIAANFWARMLTNLIDKMIAVYSAFFLKYIITEKA